MAKAKRAVGLGPTVEEISTLGHSLARVTESLQRQIGELEQRPASWADLILNRVRFEFDAAQVDRLIAQADEIIAAGDALFTMEASRHSLASWRGQLAETAALAKRFMGAR